jgi:nucleotide-binding universal stress UspA family protein
VVVSADWEPTHGEVVVGWTTDGTSDAALEFGAREASRRGNPLTIVHATSSPDPREIQRGLLAGAARGVRHEHPELRVSEVLQQGSAAVAIVRAATYAELVVVGSRGRGAITDFFLGSVSHDVLLNMPAPVAVIPHSWSPR